MISQNLLNKINIQTKYAAVCFIIIAFFASCASIDTPEIQDPIIEDEPVPTLAEEPQEEDVFHPVNFAMDLQSILQTGSLHDALNSFDTIPEEYADDEGLNYLHASLLLSVGELDKAGEIAQTLQEQGSQSTDIQLLNAVILKEQGKTQDSQRILKEILANDPQNPEANVEMANFAMKASNYAGAHNYFSQGLKGDPEDPESLFGYSLTAWYLRNDDRAKAGFTKLSEIDPNNSMAWAYLAKFEADDGNYVQAAELMQKAADCDGDYYQHWMDLGTYYRNINKFDEAEYAWTRAIEVNPHYFLAYAYRGGMYDEKNRYEEALADYEKVITYNPKYYFAYESMGVLYWREEKWQDSRNAFLKAYEASPGNTSYALMISATYQKENRLQDNKTFLTAAMRNVARDSLDYFMLRLYYDGLGDTTVLNKILAETDRNIRGEMMFYMALFYELKGSQSLAIKYYLEVAAMQAPMFFEYRLNEWAIEKAQAENSNEFFSEEVR
ncbi:MAG: tetratricopeptide repeat protein [Spirochaetales bacterium]